MEEEGDKVNTWAGHRLNKVSDSTIYILDQAFEETQRKSWLDADILPF